jgi:hypothetical protein
MLHLSMHNLQELLQRKENSMEKKITFNNENGTPSGAIHHHFNKLIDNPILQTTSIKSIELLY